MFRKSDVIFDLLRMTAVCKHVQSVSLLHATSNNVVYGHQKMYKNNSYKYVPLEFKNLHLV
jgi:hypothetical protein